MADPQAMPISAKKRNNEPHITRAAARSSPGAQAEMKARSANAAGGRKSRGGRKLSELPKALGDQKGDNEAAAAVEDENVRHTKKAKTSEKNAGDSENSPPLPYEGSGISFVEEVFVVLMRRVSWQRKHRQW